MSVNDKSRRDGGYEQGFEFQLGQGLKGKAG
jgi:hypothetical protein